MAYTKTSWVARVGTALNRFLKSNETTESVELTNDPSGVTTAGTPFTAANMNKIEQGIYDVHVTADNNESDITGIKENEAFYSKYDLIIDSDAKLALLGASTTTTYEKVFIAAGVYSATEQIDLDAHGVIIFEGCGSYSSIININYTVSGSFISVGVSTRAIRGFRINLGTSGSIAQSASYIKSDGNSKYCLLSGLELVGSGNGFGLSSFDDCYIENCFVYNLYQGFNYSDYLTNCIANFCNTGFLGCEHLTNCLAENNSDDGFRGCEFITSSKANSNSGNGFKSTYYVSACNSSSNSEAGFDDCLYMSSCGAEDNGAYGFDECNYVTSSRTSGNTSGAYDIAPSSQAANSWGV